MAARGALGGHATPSEDTAPLDDATGTADTVHDVLTTLPRVLVLGGGTVGTASPRATDDPPGAR